MVNPLKLIPGPLYVAVIYAAFSIIVGGQNVPAQLSKELFAVALPSGALWQLTLGNLFIVLSVVSLFFELLKSTNPTDSAIAGNSVSIICLVVFLLLFALLPGFGTTEFFLLTFMTALDVVVGLIVLVSTARRTIDHE